MAHQLPGGGGVVPDLNQLPPGGGEQASPPAAEVDRISALPEKARQRILGFLPLKEATMLGMVSRSWLSLVCKPQWPCDSILGIHIRPPILGPCDCRSVPHVHYEYVPMPTNVLGRRGRGPGHRLLRFFLKVEDNQTRPADFDFLLDYAADCHVEDVSLVDARWRPDDLALAELSFNFGRASHHLLCLALTGIGVNEARRPLSQFRSIGTLEVLRIHATSLRDLDLRRILASCRRLRILVLRGCRVLTCVNVTIARERLESLTVMECPQVNKISASAASGLRSFRYSGNLLQLIALPQSCFRDLYIRFTNPIASSPILYHSWLNALPNLSDLVVLCINSVALMIICCLPFEADYLRAKLTNLPNLRELKLFLFKMNNSTLSHVYRFFRMCRFPQLTNLFVERPVVKDEPPKDAVSELAEEPPMDGFNNLLIVKITNFKWHCNEIKLVQFLLRKVSSLEKVILIVPNGTVTERNQSGNPIFPDDKVVVLNERLDATIREFHRDVRL